MKHKFHTVLRNALKLKSTHSVAINTKSFNSHVIHARSFLLPFSTRSYIRNTPHFPKLFAASIFVGAATAALSIHTPLIHAESPPQPPDPSPRKFRLAEIHTHGPNAETKWIIHGTRVYDITSWIPAHPGGDIILRAVGGAIEPYWNIFSIHKKQDVYDILETYYIGDVDERDLVEGQVLRQEGVGVDDPFRGDPKRDARLMILTEKPCNAETPPGEGGLEEWVTGNGVFYVRNHMWVPEVDVEAYRLVVELPNGDEKKYSLEDLKRRFQSVSITATLQCSGNRRKHMSQEARSASGLPWGIGAISNAVWTGIRLRDVLADAGLDVDELPVEAKHAQFVGAEAYGASIPIEKAVDRRGDVLLAYEMNGQPLPPDHGYPVRVLVPGTVAARSVKWVQRVVVSEEESASQWQRRDYKCFGPNVGGGGGVGDAPPWDEAPAIQEMPVQSAITSLRDVSCQSGADRKLLQVYGLEEDCVVVEGYAWSGGGRKIVRVDVSPDDGRSWHQAELLPDQSLGSKAWAWRRWRWVVSRGQVGQRFVVKAVDEANNTQPADYEPYWNFRGNLTNSWHRVAYRRTEI